MTATTYNNHGLIAAARGPASTGPAISTDAMMAWAASIATSSIGIAVIGPGQRVLRTNRAFDSLWPAATEALEQALATDGPASLCLQAPDRTPLRLDLAERRGPTRVVTLQADALHTPDNAHQPSGVHLDPLTGLHNRLALDQPLPYGRGDAGNDASIAVTIVDLDRFKQVNDTLGHAAGDVLIQRVAQRLRTVVKRQEQILRLGGDEFVILHTLGLDRAGAHSVGQRVVDLLGRPFLVEGAQVNIGASVGIAVSQSDIDDAREILKRADLALYEAKSSGRGNYHIFEPVLLARAEARRDLEVGLRRALGLKEFVLHYQPQIDFADGRVIGFEALIRWQRTGHGLVSPADFIPLAEELGEIHAIGAWTMREACRQATTWPGDLTVAVNVSAVQFQKGDVVDIVRRALRDTGLAPARLEIEITESLLLHQTERLRDDLHALRALGVGLAMDDFGTGYSSLSYLHRFPFTKLKIDRAFIQNDRTPRSDALVHAIVDLGRTLGLTTIAEGVETGDQYQALAGQGCASAQGYLISRPLPPQRIPDYLAAGHFTLTTAAPAKTQTERSHD